MPVALWWVRRDLRLTDNQALHAALRHGEVVPVFILDPNVLNSRYHARAEKRRAFLFAGLRVLDTALRELGARLIVREGEPVGELSRLQREVGATAIFAEEDFSPHARARDAAIQKALSLALTGGVTVRHPTGVQKTGGGPYTVFTPFSKAWKALAPITPRDVLPAPPAIPFPEIGRSLSTIEPPRLRPPGVFPPGEVEAQRRLERFTHQAMFDYAEGRNQLDSEGTSALSPYFRFGMVSVRAAAVAALEAMRVAPSDAARRGAETWLNELIWREFYLHILYNFPHVLRTAFNPSLRHIAWRDAPADFDAWKTGHTGYPIVDACMRQLAETGWMHNRGRMIVASFLVKDLLINWQRGEQWFMDALVDGDPAANNGGWQWTAGVGTDAAPYFRIFNPVLQSARFDPRGRFIRRYVPELATVPDRFIHEPGKMPVAEQRGCGVLIGQTYPAPLLEHAAVKARTLAAYKQSQRLA
jgi:deoxyribodipyrimidine photo-lyase